MAETEAAQVQSNQIKHLIYGTTGGPSSPKNKLKLPGELCAHTHAVIHLWPFSMELSVPEKGDSER